MNSHWLLTSIHVFLLHCIVNCAVWNVSILFEVCIVEGYCQIFQMSSETWTKFNAGCSASFSSVLQALCRYIMNDAVVKGEYLQSRTQKDKLWKPVDAKYAHWKVAFLRFLSELHVCIFCLSCIFAFFIWVAFLHFCTACEEKWALVSCYADLHNLSLSLWRILN